MPGVGVVPAAIVFGVGVGAASTVRRLAGTAICRTLIAICQARSIGPATVAVGGAERVSRALVAVGGVVSVCRALIAIKGAGRTIRRASIAVCRTGASIRRAWTGVRRARTRVRRAGIGIPLRIGLTWIFVGPAVSVIRRLVRRPVPARIAAAMGWLATIAVASAIAVLGRH